MSQSGKYDTSTILADIETLEGNSGGKVGPDAAGNVSIIGSGGVNVTGTPGSNLLTITDTGIDQNQIIYVGKHGNDANDGLTIEKAKLTFQSAITATGGADYTVVCFDDGNYTENLTFIGQESIYSPNGHIIGSHTLATGDAIYYAATWQIPTGTTGFTFNLAGSNCAIRGNISCQGTAVGIVCLAGTIRLDLYEVGIINGALIGPTTAGDIHGTFNAVKITGTGDVFSCVDGGIISMVGAKVSNSGAGNGQLFATSGGGAPEIAATISAVNLEKLSDITAGSIVKLNAGDLNGSLAEAGAGSVSMGGASRIDNVPIGDVTPSNATFTTLVANTSLQVAALGLGVIQTDATGLASSSTGTDGQILIANTAGTAPLWDNITSTGATLNITNGSSTINMETGTGINIMSGFESWSGGAPYFDDTTLGQFTVSQAGTGYIKGVATSWIAPQTVAGLTTGNTYYIYIDNTGTIQKTTAYSESLFENNIVLFECMRDSTTGTNIQVTVKENHPFQFPWKTSVWAHCTIGSVIADQQGGANITLNGTQKIEISGADELEDHGLETDIPDSGGVAEVFEQYFTLGSGKWARHAQSDTFDGTWDNAGTATAIGANKYTTYRLYISKDNINFATPVYFAVLGDAQYNNLTQANTAIANDSVPTATGELAQLELAQLGYIVFEESSTSIVEVVIAKETLRSSFSGVTATTASLVLTDVTNFDKMLSSADTTVQAALETIDDWPKAPSVNNMTIDPGASGDSATLYSINSTPEFITGVDDTDDSYRISQGSSLGTNDVFIAQSTGEITKPLQPCFRGRIGTSILSVTGSGTLYAISSNWVEVFDVGGVFTVASGIFTAPILGKYLFNVVIGINSYTAAATRVLRYIRKNSSEFILFDRDEPLTNSSINIGAGSIILDLSAADTVDLSIVVSGEAGDVVGIEGTNSSISYTTFSGCLIT